MSNNCQTKLSLSQRYREIVSIRSCKDFFSLSTGLNLLNQLNGKNTNWKNSNIAINV